jgi:hypothetical protein
MSASANPYRPVTSPPPSPKRAKTLKCETCRNRKVKASGPQAHHSVLTRTVSLLVRSLFESNPQQCERSSPNQEKCKQCQKQGLGCGPNVPCPPKPGSATPNTNQASALSYAAVLSAPAPRETSAARTPAIPRNGAASRLSTARLRPPGRLLSGTDFRMITSSTTAMCATNNQINSDDQLNFIALK